MEDKIIREVAEQEFDRFADAMDLDLDTVGMDAEDLASMNKQKNRIIKAVMKGDLIFNDDGEAVYTPQHKRSKRKDPITFHERTGASLMAMDNKKKGHDVAKTYAILGDMCGIEPKEFSGLAGIDIKVSEAIFALLMD